MKKKPFLIVLSILILFAVSICFVRDEKKDDNQSEGQPSYEPIVIEEKFGFIGDLHFMSEEEIGDDDYESFQSYRYTGERILPLSEAILKSTVDRYIEQKVTAVFVCGDLTETGSKESLQKVADELTRLTDAGIGVYVCNGTADIRDLDPDYIIESAGDMVFHNFYDLVAEDYTPYRYIKTGRTPLAGVDEAGFREIFSSFGYNNAVSVDENSLSYACDVTDKIRLVNYSLSYYLVRSPGYPHRAYGVPKPTEESLAWLESVLMQAQTEEKEVIMMSYFPIGNDIYHNVGEVTYNFTVKMQDCELIQDLCTQYGVHYILSGSAHFISEQTFDDLDGSPACTNITCTSLTNYPLEHYYVTYGTGWSYESEQLQTINEKYLPTYYTEEEKEEITSDLKGFSIRYLEKEIRKKIGMYFDNMRFENFENAYFRQILIILCACKTEKDRIAWGQELREISFNILDMPLYGENSMDTCLQKYGLRMPESDYTSLLNLIVRNFCDIYEGKYDNSEGSLNRKLFLGIGYALLDMTADYGVFTRLHAVNKDVADYDTHRITEKVIEEGYVNFTWDNLILHIVSIANAYVKANSNLDFSGTNINTVLTLLDIGICVGLKIAYPWAYQEDDELGAIFGISISHYLNIKDHSMDVNKMIEDFFFDLIVRDMLN